MTRFATLMAGALFVAGCGGGNESEPASETDDHQDEEMGIHYDGPDHDHGKMVETMEYDLETLKVSATITTLEREGQDLAFNLSFTPGSSAPEQVIAWLGTEEEKITEDIELLVTGSGRFHEHLEAPTPWNEDWELWVKFDHLFDGETTINFPIQSELKTVENAE